MLDLLKIAKTEAAGGDLVGLLGELLQPSDVRPTGYPDAVIWQGGNHDGKVNPARIARRSWEQEFVNPFCKC